MMKKKMSKFTRILIASIIGIITLGTACWGVQKLVASGTYEPIVWRFNNEADFSKLSSVTYKADVKFYDGEEGKKAISLSPQDKYSTYFSFPASDISDVNFSNYKYLVFSEKCVNKPSEDVSVYISSSAASNQSIRFHIPSDLGWTTTVVDVAGKKAYTYDSEGEKIYESGFYEEYAVEYWTGELTNLRIDYAKYCDSGTVYIEYIGLFHSKEEALAYAGAMPNDEAADAITTTLAEGYTLPFSQAATEDMAKEYAAKKVTETVDTYCTENDEIAYDVQIKEITDYKIDGTGGSFKARVWVYLGDALKRNLIDETITFKVNAKPDPVAVVYDSESKVSGASFWAADTDTYTKKFVEDASLKTGGYLQLSGSSTSNFNPMYNNYLSQAGVSSTFSCDEYPYMKMLYKRNVTITDESTQVYMFGANGQNGSWSFDLYKVSSEEEPYWQAMVTDMRSCAVTFYNTEGNVTGTTTSTHSTTGLAWEGTPNSLRFDLTKLGKAERTMGVAYIAFFATEAEAIAYPNSIQGAFDASMLENNASFEVGNFVTTEELALAEAEAYVDDFGFTTTYAISNGEFTAPSTTAEGTYTFDVTFTDNNGTYSVSCTMTIAKTEVPIVYTLDNTGMVSKFQATGNLKKTLEDGYLKMTSPYPEQEDGFYLEAATSALGEEFDLAGRRFAKVRYKLSGVEGKESSTKMQFYTVVDGKYYSKSGYVFSAEDEGDIVELIVDFSASGTVEALWIKNVTDGSDYQIKTLSNPDEITPLGAVTRIRFNPARVANADRTSYVEYIGFFSSLEEAKEYDGIAQKRLDEAEEKLKATKMELVWGDGNTEEKALAKLNSMIQSDIGCTLQDIVYTAPTEQAEGSVTFTAELVSGGVSRKVENLKLTIERCPDAVIWRFNEESALDNMNMMENTNAVIENNVLKLVNTYPSDGSGFGFTVDTPDEDTQFYLQNNPYIVVKYRRDGLGPVNIRYTTDLYENTSFYPSNNNLGFGPESGTWYTSVIDTNVTDRETPLVRNYSHDENVEDFNFYIPYKVRLDSWVLGDAYKFKGLSQRFSFALATFKDVERTCYIEYIGFFPTLDAALDYEEEYESVKSDTEVALKAYEGETVSYYDGCDETAAKKTAQRLIDKLLLDDVHPIKKLDDVDIAIETISYDAPEKDVADGAYTFSATMTYNDQEIYKLNSCTLTISKNAEKQVYLFTNPDFVNTINGAGASDKYDYMQLREGVKEFTLDVSNRNVSLANYPRVSLGVTEATGPVTMTVNGETLTLCEEGIVKDTELSVVFSDTGYTVYQGTGEISAGTLTENVIHTTLDDIRFAFGSDAAKVRYLVFFTEASVSEVFDAAVPEELAGVTDITDGSCHAGDASTSAKAVERARKLVLNQVGSKVTVAKATLSEYKAATTTDTGAYSCEVLISYGEKEATYYKAVEVSGVIAKQPADPIFIDNEKFVNNKRYDANLDISLKDGCIHTETESASVEDSYFLFYKGDLTNSNLYLPDYPYISIKFKRTGDENGKTGDSQIYFYSDETKGNPGLTCSLGGADILDEWVTAILDINTKTITLYDMDDEKVNTTRTIVGSFGQYVGNMEYMRLTMARSIKVDRTADIEYVGFFSTMEEAKKYMGGLFIDDYTQFTGNECAVVNQAIDSKALTVELAAKMDAATTDVVRPLISNKGDGDSYFALEVTTAGTLQLTCGSQVVATTDESVATGRWAYITASVDEDSAKIYLNGKLAAEGTSDIDVDAIKADTLVVGGDHVSDSNSYVGNMANLKLYNAVKEPTNYEMPETLTQDMIAGWALDAITTSRQFVGYASSEYTLTFNNELSRQGHEFIGSDCLISEKEITAAPQTFAGWMNVSRKQLSGTYSLVSTSGMKVQLVDGQIVAFYNDAEVLRTTELELVPGMWTHIAVTFDTANSKVTIYVNGESKGTSTTSMDTSVTLSKVYIGATDKDADMFVGMLSDIRLWSEVRTDIVAAMTADLETDDAGLLGAWDILTRTNLDYADVSANNNKATLTSDSWYKLEGRETPAYSIVHIGDTQNSTGFNGEPKFQAMFDWIAENVDTMNMVYLTHAGDVTQINTEAQWAEAKEGFDKIEGLLPYAISLGNHDYAAPSHGIAGESRDDRHFNKYFEYDEYAKNSWFGEAFEEGSRTNLYNLIDVDWNEDGTVDEEYLFMALEYGPRDEVVDWACEALEKYSDRKAIITTHCYFETNGSYEIKDVHMSGYEWKDANEGFDLWNKILYEYPNVVMLTCGHSQGEATWQQVNKNKVGNNVVQILADPSAYNGFPSVDSLIFMLNFDAEGNMHTYYYSADRDLYYGTCNEFDYSADDHFKIPTSESK